MEVEEYSWGRADGTRHGFNGKEADDEIKGSGNAYDFGGRSIYDGRVARFISIDPDERIYPWQSTYVYAASNPIKLIDRGGRGPQGNGLMTFNIISIFDAKNAYDILKQKLIDGAYEISRQKAIESRKHPDWTYSQIYWKAQANVLWGRTHTGLDILGTIPAIGEPFDAINGGLYALEGDYVNAGISFAAVIPIVGESGKVAKYMYKAFEGSKTISKKFHSLNRLNKYAKLVGKYGGKVGDAIYYAKDGALRMSFNTIKTVGEMAGKHAHHLIPVELLKKNPLVQKAVNAGWGFNKAEVNGLMLEAWKHIGGGNNNYSHYWYSAWVEKRLGEVKSLYQKYGDIDDKAAKDILDTVTQEAQEIISEMKTGETLDGVFFELLD